MYTGDNIITALHAASQLVLVKAEPHRCLALVCIVASCCNSSIVFSPHLWDIIARGDHDRGALTIIIATKIIFFIVILL